MKRRTLGATGISVSEVALGAMMFGARGNPDHDESVRMIHTALDAGVNFIDTADVYSVGESEEIVAKAIKGRRDEVVLATKFGLPMGPDANERGGSSRYIKRAIEDSLRRLGTDHVDLYQLHRADYDTSLDETLAALSDLVHAGKVRAIGSSMFPAERIAEAQWAAETGGHRRFLSEQLRYSILSRAAEGHVLPSAQRYDMGVLAFSPLNGGWLSGRSDPTKGQRPLAAAKDFDVTIPANRAKLVAVEQLTELAHDVGVPLSHLAIAFVRSHPAITSVLMGPRTPEQLDDLLAGVDVELSEDVLDRIDDIVKPGTELNPDDNYFTLPPALLNATLRRR
ncbi:MAG TPA: aldo/keto reductase [Acidimicrobiales bacterium]|jgi:aryl-alcohol dehydrogenase-like predicted oxidoreductase|nr:aldo/keto reductase [Acidimicrobiales bacterium]